LPTSSTIFAEVEPRRGATALTALASAAVVLGIVAAAALGVVAVALPAAAKVVLLPVGAIGLTGWATWSLLSRPLGRAREWAAPNGGAVVDTVLLWVFVEVSWAGLWRGPGGVRISDLLLVGLGVYGLRGLRTAPPAVRRMLGLLALALGLVVAGAVLATLDGGAAPGDVEVLARTGFAMLLIPAVVVRFVRSERRFEAALLATVVSVSVASIVAALGQFADLWVLPFDDDFNGERSYGLSNHPALFGITAAAALPLSVGLGLATRGATRAVAFVCVPLLLVGALLSASRAPLGIGALAVVGLLLALGAGGRRARVGLMLALVAMAAAAGAVLPERLARLSDPGAQQSALARVELGTTAIDEIAASPLIGEGAGVIKGGGGVSPTDNWSGSTALRIGGGRGDPDAGAHNLVLQSWRALGLLGLVGLSMAIMLGVFSGVSAVRISPRGRTRTLAQAVLASFAVVLACLMFFDAVFERQLWLTLGLLCALGLGARRWAVGSEDASREGESGAPSGGRGPVVARS
jgi:hypothetical protein